MVTSETAAFEAEELLAAYIVQCEASTPDDLRKLLEMLISKAGRAVEKYCGNDVAADVLFRTVGNIQAVPAQQTIH